MTNSREKGKRGEREFVKLLNESGIRARRGVQYKGGPDSPDIEILDRAFDEWHFEVKRVERLSLYPALEQAEKDAKHRFPVVAHKRNGKPWVAIVPMNHYLDLVTSFIELEETVANARIQ